MAGIIGGVVALIGADALATAGLGTAATETALALGAGETVSNLAGGAAIATAAGYIKETVEEGINQAIDLVVPEETQNMVYDFFSDLKAVYNLVDTGDEQAYSKYVSQKANEKKIKDKEVYVGKDRKNPTYNPQGVLPYGANPVITNSDIDPTVHYVDRPFDENDNEQGENIITAQQDLKTANMQNYSASDLADFVIDYSSDLSFTKEPVKSLNDYIEKNPSKLGLIQRLNNFLAEKSLPSSDEFKEIYEIYNGRSITRDSFKWYTDEEGLFHIVATDEVGFTFDMPENTGLVLPSVPPYVFVGPNSKNDRPPTDSVVDYFAVFHDYGFRNGLNRIADMKFVSRLSQNKDRLRPDEINFVNSTIVYFSNISMTIGRFFGSQNPEDLIKGPQENMIMDDIFPVLQPSAKELEPEEYQSQRYKFYEDLDNALKEKSVTSSMFTQISSSSVGKYYAQEFGEILIQVI